MLLTRKNLEITNKIYIFAMSNEKKLATKVANKYFTIHNFY